MNTIEDNFYVVGYEPGSIDFKLPLWATSTANPFGISQTPETTPYRINIDEVPGAFQLIDVFDKAECNTIINSAKSMGYTEDAAVSLGRNIRHNMNLNLIVDNTTEQLIWSRIENLITENDDHFLGKKPLGLNQRFRFYRYEKGDYFATHTDGSWPGSQVINNKPITDAFGDRHSLFTCLIFLSDDFTGGATEFLVDPYDNSKPARVIAGAQKISIRTPKGGMLLFPHGHHPLHCLHNSELISHGIKHIIRTDILFSL